MRIERATLRQVWAHMALMDWRAGATEYALLVNEVMSARVFVAIDDREAPLVLGGIIPSPGRTMSGMGWLSVVPGIGREFLAVVKAAGRVLAAARRFPGVLECVIRDDNPQGARLGRLLGFIPTEECVGPKRYWRAADGRLR